MNMTPLEIRRSQGNYVNNDEGAFVERQKELDLINMMDPTPESKEIEDIKQRLNKIEIFMFDLRGEMVNAIIGLRDPSFFMEKLEEYGAERFDLNAKLTILRSK